MQHRTLGIAEVKGAAHPIQRGMIGVKMPAKKQMVSDKGTGRDVQLEYLRSALPEDVMFLADGSVIASRALTDEEQKQVREYLNYIWCCYV